MKQTTLNSNTNGWIHSKLKLFRHYRDKQRMRRSLHRRFLSHTLTPATYTLEVEVDGKCHGIESAFGHSIFEFIQQENPSFFCSPIRWYRRHRSNQRYMRVFLVGDSYGADRRMLFDLSKAGSFDVLVNRWLRFRCLYVSPDDEQEDVVWLVICGDILSENVIHSL